MLFGRWLDYFTGGDVRDAFAALTLVLLCGGCNAQEAPPPGTYPATTSATQKPNPHLFKFQDVYCLEFPAGADTQLQEQFFSNSAVHLVRAEYPNRTMLNVVVSTVPDGRDPNQEFDRLVEVERNLEAGYQTDYHLTVQGSGSDRVIHERIYDVTPGGKGGPFPLVRALFKRDDAPRLSVTSHRIFVRGTNRYEVAAYRLFESPASPEELAGAEKAIDNLADQATTSILQCRA
jgi:hypothetical protein